MPRPVDEAAHLRKYTLAKQEVVEAVRALKRLLEAQGRTDSLKRCQALLVKLAEDRFNLAVVGQFKRGKSSLMNAVVGRDLLPTGLLPLTSAITTLCYGPQERALLRRKALSFEQEVPLDQLEDYITERGNPGNEKGLLEARVELPVGFLRRGLHFIDTPGIGSARQENTATTYAFLPEADAVIFVTSVEGPLSGTEVTFLHDIREHVRKLFVVVNKIDLLGPDEHDAVLGYIREGVEQTLGRNEIRLYPLSARQGLAGKLSQDGAGLQSIGLAALEQALTSFLADEQGRTFLVAILDRALQLLAIEDLDEVEWTLPEPGKPTSSEATQAGLRVKMESLRAVFLSGASFSLTESVSDLGATGEHVLERAVEVSRSKQPRRDGRVLFHRGTCPICAAQSRAIFDFFAHWQYLLASSAAARREFTAVRGFCAMHTWQFEQVASPQGISEGYAPLIDLVVAEVRSSLGQPAQQALARIGALLPSVETCAACQVLHEVERETIGRFLAQIARTEGRELYGRSEGLCLAHLHMALAALPSNEVVDFLLREQSRRLEEISEDMRSYTLKRDALRRGLLNAQEESAWRRALVQFAGERNARVL